MILMCKNKAVYDIDAEIIIDKNLLPGSMLKDAGSESFKNWLKKRYNSGTNTLARQLRGVTFGQGNRIQIDKTTRALSLSDCYWLKDEHDTIVFEDISPYYNKFWNGEGEYDGGSIPTLYVPGYISKAWISREYLYKKGCEIEITCSEICLKAGLDCAEVCASPGGITVKNFTDTKYMLEQADMSGRFDDEYFTEADIIKEFGADGYKMILIDAVFGNGDRHLGNFGYMRDTESGAYIKMAPLYDFDHALDATVTDDILIKNAVKLAAENIKFRQIAESITDLIIKMDLTDLNDIFRLRAGKIKGGLI